LAKGDTREGSAELSPSLSPHSNSSLYRLLALSGANVRCLTRASIRFVLISINYSKTLENSAVQSENVRPRSGVKIPIREVSDRARKKPSLSPKADDVTERPPMPLKPGCFAIKKFHCISCQRSYIDSPSNSMSQQVCWKMQALQCSADNPHPVVGSAPKLVLACRVITTRLQMCTYLFECAIRKMKVAKTFREAQRFKH
jgi:hypothetical protein